MDTSRKIDPVLKKKIECCRAAEAQMHIYSDAYDFLSDGARIKCNELLDQLARDLESAVQGDLA